MYNATINIFNFKIPDHIFFVIFYFSSVKKSCVFRQLLVLNRAGGKNRSKSLKPQTSEPLVKKKKLRLIE